MIDVNDITTLRPARRHAELTQKVLAQRVGMQTSAICEMEKGKFDPRLSQWLRIVSVVREALGGREMGK